MCATQHNVYNINIPANPTGTKLFDKQSFSIKSREKCRFVRVAMLAKLKSEPETHSPGAISLLTELTSGLLGGANLVRGRSREYRHSVDSLDDLLQLVFSVGIFSADGLAQPVQRIVACDALGPLSRRLVEQNSRSGNNSFQGLRWRWRLCWRTGQYR